MAAHAKKKKLPTKNPPVTPLDIALSQVQLIEWERYDQTIDMLLENGIDGLVVLDEILQHLTPVQTRALFDAIKRRAEGEDR